MMTLNHDQIKLIAGFFSNMAIVWFAAAFIEPRDIVTMFRAGLSGVFSLAFGIVVLKEVKG